MRPNLASNRISRRWRVALHHSRRPQSSRRARITGLKQKNRGPAWPCARKLGGGARQQCVARLEAEAAKARQEAELQHKGTGRCILLNFNNDSPTPPTPPTLPPPRRQHAHPVTPHLLHAAAASPLWRQHHRRCPIALARRASPRAAAVAAAASPRSGGSAKALHHPSASCASPRAAAAAASRRHSGGSAPRRCTARRLRAVRPLHPRRAQLMLLPHAPLWRLLRGTKAARGELRGAAATQRAAARRNTRYSADARRACACGGDTEEEEEEEEGSSGNVGVAAAAAAAAAAV